MSEGYGCTKHRLEVVLEKIERVTSVVFVAPCLVAIIAWVFVFTICTIARYFGASWPFLEEFTEYWLVLIVFFSMSYTLWKGGHIFVDIVITRVPKRVKNIMVLLTGMLSVVVSGYLASQGFVWFDYALSKQVHAPTPINTPLWPVYLLIPIGFSVLTLVLFLELFRSVIRIQHGAETKSHSNAEAEKEK